MRGFDLRLIRPRPAGPAHGDRLRIADGVVRLAVNARARRISLRLDVASREVVATAPTRAKLGQAVAFAQSRAGWIAGRLAALAPVQPFVPGAVIPLHGEPCRLEQVARRSTGRVVAATGDAPARLMASGEDAVFARAVERVLRREASTTLTERTVQAAARLRHPPPHVAVADPRRRWGSCRAACDAAPARIRYSWRLICAPPAVLDYVVAHECAHLVEPNHAPAFWALTRDLYGDVEPARAWLRRNGAALQALGGVETSAPATDI